MKKLTLILVVLLVVAGVVYFFINSEIKSPEFKSFENIQLDSISQDNVISVKADLILKNPNIVEAKLLSTDLSILTQNTKVGSVYLVKITDIHPNSDFKLPLSFKIYLNKVIETQGLSGILEKALNEERKFTLNFNGVCRIQVNKQLFKVPVNYTEEIVLK